MHRVTNDLNSHEGNRSILRTNLNAGCIPNSDTRNLQQISIQDAQAGAANRLGIPNQSFLLLLIAPKQKNFCVTKDRVPLRGWPEGWPRIVLSFFHVFSS